MTTGSTNNYLVSTTPALSTLIDGVSIYIKINITNTDASTLNWNSLGAKPIVDTKGNALTAGKLLAGSIVGVRYNATTENFQLLGEGGNVLTGDADPEDVLLNKTFYKNNPETKLIGTLALTGDTTAANVLAGKKFYSTDAKVQITGTMPNRAGDNACLASSVAGTTLKLRAPNGFFDGVDDNVTINDVNFISSNIKMGVNVHGLEGTLDASGIDTSDATAVATDILSTKTAYVNGVKLTGTMPNNGALGTITPATTNQNIPAGYTSGGIVAGDADLVAGNIKSGINLFGVLGTLAGAPSHGSQAFTSGGTFTVPTGVTLIFILCVGGGGGGGRGWDISYPGGGGASGYYGIKIVAVTPGTQYAVTVGAAGAGASYPSGYPGQGGASSVGSLISVGGGYGGANGSNDGTGGYGGVDAYPAASGATYGNNSFGGAANTTGYSPANRGANSLTGTGGAYRTSAGAGNAASGYGAGGGGAFASYAGGPGSQGLVYIWW